jgi:hypothetical protein
LMTNAIFLEIGTKIAKQHAQKASKTWFWIRITLLVTVPGRRLPKFRS